MMCYATVSTPTRSRRHNIVWNLHQLHARSAATGVLLSKTAAKKEYLMRLISGMLAALSLLVISCGTGQATTVGPGGSAQGITYDFSLIGGALNTTNATFNVHITGINAVTDLEGGRSGINAFAFSTPGLPAISTGSTTLVGAPFNSGGLNSGGCNGSGGFFCFGNTGAAGTPALPANSVIDIAFTLTLASGNFLSWTPAWKIDWAGSKNNYDLVSQDIPLGPNGTPFDVPPPAVPIPGAVWLFASGIAIGGAVLKRRRRRKEVDAS
jgi:hypothetical protein